MIDTTKATNSLRVLAAAFPTFPLGDDTVALYVAGLVGAAASASALDTAVREWVSSEDRFPTLAQLLDRLGAAARTEEALARPRTPQLEEARTMGAERLSGTIAELKRKIAEREAAGIVHGEPLPDRLHGCGACSAGLVEDLLTEGGLRPCENCNPDGYRRYLEGHYSPEHDSDHCAECCAVRRGRKIAS